MDRVSVPLLIVMVLLVAAPLAWAAEEEQLADPMRPENYRQAPVAQSVEQNRVDTTSWSLTAVLSSADRAVAVINGRLLQKGDVLKGYRVMSIHADRALLQNDEKQLVLHRSGTGLKKNIR